MLVGVQKKKRDLPRSFETTWKLCHKLSLPTFSYNDILCNASFLTFAVMFSPLLMKFSLFLSYLSPVFHSFVAFCHLALVTVSFILCIMLCCDDDDTRFLY